MAEPNGKQPAFYDAFDAVKLTLPDGETVVDAKPITVKRAAHYLRLLDTIAAGGVDAGGAHLELFERFPEEIGIADVVEEHVHPGEIIILVSDFYGALLAQRRRTQGQRTAPSPTGG